MEEVSKGLGSRFSPKPVELHLVLKRSPTDAQRLGCLGDVSSGF